jgi:hypothetical protein
MATNTHATIEILLETMSSIRFVQNGYKRKELRVGRSVECSFAFQIAGREF